MNRQEYKRNYMREYMRKKRADRPLDEPDMTKAPKPPKQPQQDIILPLLDLDAKDKVIQGLNNRIKQLETEVNRLKRLPKPKLPEIKDGKLTYCRHGLLYCEVCHDNHK